MFRTRRSAPYLVLLALLGFAAAPSVAAGVHTSPEEAAKFIQGLGSQAAPLLASNDEAAPGKNQQAFKALVRRGFDLDTIGRFAHGVSWQSATPAQREEYLRLFSTWTANSYAIRLGATKGGSLIVIDAQPIAETDALVHTRIDRPDGESIEVDLRVHGADGQMKIVDMLMGGVSMDVTQREEFASVIQHRGLDGLIGNLRARVNNLQAEAGPD